MQLPARLDPHALHELRLLEQVARSPRLNNRTASQVLGVSVKLAHEVLKKMVVKGLVHVHRLHARRWDYFLTPAGLSEKARLTMEFLDFSLQFYREARRRSAALCRALAEQGHREVAILGAGDLAEITYLGIQEWQLHLVRVYDNTDRKQLFHAPVLPVAAMAQDESDAIIVCVYDATVPLQERYLPGEIPVRANMHWIFGDR